MSLEMYIQIEKIIFEKYINELSNDAFKCLMKLLYYSKSTDKNIIIRREKSIKRALGINPAAINDIWEELMSHGLVIKKEKNSEIVYVLNGRKIREENSVYKEGKEPRNISVSILNSKLIEQKVDEPIKEQIILEQTDTSNLADSSLTDEQVLKYMNKLLETTDKELISLLLQTIKYLRQHNFSKEKRYTMTDLKKLFAGIAQYDDFLIKEACYRYNSNGNIAGFRSYKYFIRIVESVKEDINNPNKNKRFAREGHRIVDGKEVKITTENALDKIQIKEDGEIKFAKKLAMGKIEHSTIYIKLLDTNIKKLKELYYIGQKILIDNNQEDKLFEDYSWLE